jgi:hypothetical protein
VPLNLGGSGVERPSWRSISGAIPVPSDGKFSVSDADLLVRVIDWARAHRAQATRRPMAVQLEGMWLFATWTRGQFVDGQVLIRGSSDKRHLEYTFWFSPVDPYWLLAGGTAVVLVAGPFTLLAGVPPVGVLVASGLFAALAGFIILGAARYLRTGLRSLVGEVSNPTNTPTT